MADPTYNGDLQASTLDDLLADAAYDNFFVETAYQQHMRAIGGALTEARSEAAVSAGRTRRQLLEHAVVSKRRSCEESKGEARDRQRREQCDSSPSHRSPRIDGRNLPPAGNDC